SKAVIIIDVVIVFKCYMGIDLVCVQVWRCYCIKRFASALAVDMTDDPLDAMKARWSYIQGFLFPWMREDNDPITEALGRVVTTLDVIGLEAFVPEPPRGPGRPPEDRRALARAFVAKAVLGGRSHHQRPDRAPRRRQVPASHPRLGATLASSFRSHVFPGVRRVRARRAARQDPRRADRACARGTHHRGDRARRHRDRSAREAG